MFDAEAPQGTEPPAPALGHDRFVSQDFWSGLMVAAFSAAALVEASGLPVESGEVGPGFFPFWIGIILAIFAAMLLVNALRGRSFLVGQIGLRALFFAMVGMLAFALLLPLAGGAAAMVGLVTLTALGEPGRTLRELLLLNLAIVIPAWLIFVVGLSVQISMF